MTTETTNRDRFAKIFLLLLAAVVSAVFFLLVRNFLISILLAAILSGMTHPLYRGLRKIFRGRRNLASASTIGIVFLVVFLPLAGFIGIVTAQAVDVSRSVGPWIESRVNQPDELDRWIGELPFADVVAPYRAQISTKIGELAGLAGTFLVNSLAAATRGTVSFLLQLFIMLYAMFFFLMDGRKMLDRILYYLPLGPDEENLMVGKFVSVTRATLKGTAVIGIIQGGLAGLGFLFAGVGGAAFWGTVMAVLSIIPGVGTALVWIPACVYLVATGHLVAAILLALWCVAIVGTVDNVLRPRLIGKDTKMSDLMILIGTLGGMLVFGAVGVIVGPIIAALFVTVWELYGTAFSEYLPETRPSS